MVKRILLTGGGTGGHIFPLVAVTQSLRQSGFPEEPEIRFIGTTGPGINVLKNEGVSVRTITTGKIRRSFGFWDLVANLMDALKTFIGFIQVFWHIWVFMPDVIFSKGGFGSFPVVCVGWLYHIPIIIHESDSIPGLTNIIAGKLAKNIALSFERSAGYFNKKKTALTGNPIRSGLLSGNKEKAKSVFDISSTRPVILVLGGSQGSRPINEIILQILSKLVKNFEIIHQCGEKNYKELRIKVDKILGVDSRKYYHLYPFLHEELQHAYALSDLIVSRAGAANIFEIAATGKASILIPLPNAAGDHQRFNAFDYAKSGATVVLRQENLTKNMFLEKIEYLIINKELRQKMGKRAKEFARPDAANQIADKILELTHR